MNLYRNVLSSALKLTWKHKYLWFFGLFATLLGSTGELELIFGAVDGDLSSTVFFPEFSKWAETGIFSINGIKNILNLAIHEPFTFFIICSLLLAVLILGLFLFWLTIVSQAGLVFNATKIRLEKKHSFKDGLSAGMKNFWSVFGLNFLMKFVFTLLFGILVLPLVRNTTSLVAANIFIVLFLVFIPLSILISFVVKYAVAFVVVRNMSFLESIKEGVKLFKENWLVSIEMAFLLFMINFVSWLVLILLFLVLAVPIIFILFVSQAIFVINFVLFQAAALLVAFIFVLVFGSFLSSFQISAWTMLFVELISKGGKSKLNRVFS